MAGFNWGTALAGGAGGVLAGGGVASVPLGVLGFLGGGLAGGDMGKNGQAAQPGGWQWLQNPQYAETAPAMGTLWDYVAKGTQALSEGKPPTWFQQWRPLEETQRKNALYGTYWGGNAARGAGMNTVGQGFGAGLLQQQQAADIAAGRRGAGAGSNFAKQLDQYAKGMQDIDNYLSQLGATSMQTAEQNYLQAGASLPQGPSGQWGYYGGTAYQPSGMESIMQGAGSLTPYLLSALQNTGKSTPITTNNTSDLLGVNSWFSNPNTYLSGQYMQNQAQATPYNPNYFSSRINDMLSKTQY